jgi:hypothetical protein
MNKRKTLILDRAEFLRHCLDLRPELRDEPEFGIVVNSGFGVKRRTTNDSSAA